MKTVLACAVLTIVAFCVLQVFNVTYSVERWSIVKELFKVSNLAHIPGGDVTIESKGIAEHKFLQCEQKF